MHSLINTAKPTSREIAQPKITLIDTGYIVPEFAAVYLLQVPGFGLHVIETGIASTVSRVIQEVESSGFLLSDVKGIWVTHVHLDHSAGASAMAAVFKQATVYAHVRAAPHLIDPTLLVKSAKGVYGEAEFERLYGKIGAIESSRVHALMEGEKQGPLQWFEVRGHANHHGVLWWADQKTVFTGDSFGLSYPAIERLLGRPLFIPSTSPTDFDGLLAQSALQKILSLGSDPDQPALVEAVAFTHYGILKGRMELERAAQELKVWLLKAMELQAQVCVEIDLFLSAKGISRVNSIGAIDKSILDSNWILAQNQRVEKELVGFAQGLLNNAAALEYLALDLKINAQGIVVAALRQVFTKGPK